jgi:hypothetical protein
MAHESRYAMTVIPSAARDLYCGLKDPSGFALGMTGCVDRKAFVIARGL